MELLWNLLAYGLGVMFSVLRAGQPELEVICSHNNPCARTDERANGLVYTPGQEVWGWGRRLLPSSFPGAQCVTWSVFMGCRVLGQGTCGKQSLFTLL